MDNFIVYLADLLSLNIAFFLVFILPSYPVISTLFPKFHKSTNLLLSIICGITGGIICGMILFSLGVYSIYSFVILIITYYSILYLTIRILNIGPIDLKSVVDAYISLFSSAKKPLEDVWASITIVAFIASAILRYHSTLTTVSMGSSDAWGHLYMARNLLYNRIFFTHDFYGSYPRGTHIIYCEMSTITNISLMDTIKFVGPMFGTLTMLALYAFARELYGRKIASISTILYIIPVLGLLPPPFPVWFGYLFPRQTWTLTENIGFLFMISQILIAIRMIPQFHNIDSIFFTVISVIFAYVHPISVYYTMILLVFVGIAHADILLKRSLRVIKYICFASISPLTVYIYFTTIKMIYGIPPSGAKSEVNIVSEVINVLFGLPYYNINPYYTSILLCASIVLGYAILNKKRNLIFLASTITLFTFLSCMGIGLFTSPSRPVYILNFYIAPFYAIGIRFIMCPYKIIEVLSQLSHELGLVIQGYINYHNAILLYPSSLIAVISTYSVLFYLNFSSFSPLAGDIPVRILSLVPYMAAPIFIYLVTKSHRLFYGIVSLEMISALITYTIYNLFGIYIAMLYIIFSIVLLCYMHIKLSTKDRQIIILLETMFLILIVIYILPSSSVVRKIFPLLLLLAITPVLTHNIKKLYVVFISILGMSLYVAIREISLLNTLPWYYIAFAITIPAIILIYISNLRFIDSLIVTFISIYIPLIFSTYYLVMFALSLPFVVMLCIWAFQRPNKSESRHNPNMIIRIYVLIVSVYLLVELILLYPTVKEYMVLHSMGHFIVKLSWTVPEFLAVLVLIWCYRNKQLLSHNSPLQYESVLIRDEIHPYTPKKVAYRTEAMKIATVVLLFIMVLPPYVPLREIPTFHYEEWISNISYINHNFPDNDTVIYSSLSPGFLTHTAFSDDIELRTISQLLEVPPRYYMPIKRYTLICVDKYNYSTYAGISTRHFPDDYWRTPEVYRWLEEYVSYHGNGSLKLYIDGRYTSVYLITSYKGSHNFNNMLKDAVEVTD